MAAIVCMGDRCAANCLCLARKPNIHKLERHLDIGRLTLDRSINGEVIDREFCHAEPSNRLAGEVPAWSHTKLPCILLIALDSASSCISHISLATFQTTIDDVDGHAEARGADGIVTRGLG